MKKSNPLIPNVAIIDISTVEEFNFCNKYCGNYQHRNDTISKSTSLLNTICYDDGDRLSTNFWFWELLDDDDVKKLDSCTKYTFDEFSEFIEEQKQLNPEKFI